MRLALGALAAVIASVGLGTPARAATQGSNQSGPNHTGTSGAPTFVNWPAYLDGGSHSSVSPATTITPATKVDDTPLSTWRCPGRTTAGQPAASFVSSPSVYNGVIYIGCNTGVFYAVNETTPSVLWSRMLGYVTNKTCAARGVSSTATVAADPSTGKPTVYVSGGDGRLYALDAATGTVVWQSVIGIPSNTANDYYDWSSPAVSNGHVYIGVSSQCDKPFVPGGAKEYDQHTGALLATYTSSLAGAPGAGVWTSPAIGSDGSVYVTTASGDKTTPGDAYSVVRLADLGAGMSKRDIWTIPTAEQVGDSDFGGSPTMFTANLPGSGQTEMLGACNKNGVYYAWRANQLASGPVWRVRLGVGTPHGVSACLGAAIWDGSHLFAPGNATTINGTAYNGSVRELDPATGTPLWQAGLGGIVLGSPSMDAAGVIAAPTYGPSGTNGVYLINAASGAVIQLLDSGTEFAQPVFADTYLVLANNVGVLKVYSLPGGVGGKVADGQTSLGIAGATVTCTCSSATKVADGAGSYSFADVAAGMYSITFSAGGYTTKTSTVVVTAGRTITQNATLDEDGGIDGAVTNSTTHGPVSGATVTCTCSGSSAATDGNGRYGFNEILPASDYSVTFSASGAATQTIIGVVVTPGTTTTENAQLARGGGITGHVTDGTVPTHPPVQGATVTCACPGGGATTEANGSFSITGVPAGTYSLTFSAATFVTRTIGAVSVVPGTNTSQDAALTDDGGISGTVTDAQTGTPISGATVACTCAGGSRSTAGDGTYGFADVPNGTYMLTLSRPGYVVQTVNGIAVTGPTTTVRDAALTEDGGISGTVTDAQTGTPISGATVMCTCAGSSTTTRADGTYGFADVSNGNYTLAASKTGYVTNAITSVGVTGPNTTVQDASLTEDGAISGTVSDAQTGLPISGATVSCTCPGGSTTTGTGGVYALTNVAPGTYGVSVTASGHSTRSVNNVVVRPGTNTVQDFTLAADSHEDVFSDGFESGNLSAWTTSTSLAVESTKVHVGTFAAEAKTTIGSFARENLPSTYPTGYGRVWFDIVSESSVIDVLRLNNASGVPIDYLYVTQSRALALSANGTRIVSSTPVTTGRFHEIELALTVNGASSTTQVWLDGKLVPALSGTSNLGTLPIAQLQLGQAQSGGIYDVVFDDAAFDTTFLP